MSGTTTHSARECHDLGVRVWLWPIMPGVDAKCMESVHDNCCQHRPSVILTVVTHYLQLVHEPDDAIACS